MASPLKIGIAGARGIGKHHAKWYANAGCEVVAVYGTTEESANAAAAGLTQLFPFAGRAFWDWDRFLREGGFEACSVCSPAERHRENVEDLAAAGVHVLCEKPLAWDWDQPPLRMIEEATAAVEAAARHNVLLGVNAQYPAALDGFEALHRQATGRDPEYHSLRFLMESKGKPRSHHGAAEVWVDLGPHLIAVIDRIGPGTVDWSTLRHTDGPLEAVLDFVWVNDTRRIPVRIECRRTTDGSVRRQLGNQDLTATYESCTLDGHFAARLTDGRHEWTGKDFMRVSVERFVDAVRAGDPAPLLVDAVSGLRQQEALVGIWEHCWQSGADGR